MCIRIGMFAFCNLALPEVNVWEIWRICFSYSSAFCCSWDPVSRSHHISSTKMWIILQPSNSPFLNNYIKDNNLQEKKSRDKYSQFKAAPIENFWFYLCLLNFFKRFPSSYFFFYFFFFMEKEMGIVVKTSTI